MVARSNGTILRLTWVAASAKRLHRFLPDAQLHLDRGQGLNYHRRDLPLFNDMLIMGMNGDDLVSDTDNDMTTTKKNYRLQNPTANCAPGH